jgi:hypothetical protein
MVKHWNRSGNIAATLYSVHTCMSVHCILKNTEEYLLFGTKTLSNHLTWARFCKSCKEPQKSIFSLAESIPRYRFLDSKTAVLIAWDPAILPPPLGSYTKALLVSQDRQHLFDSLIYRLKAQSFCTDKHECQQNCSTFLRGTTQQKAFHFSPLEINSGL